MSLLISKIGKYHLDSGLNKQDAGYIDEKIKFVADGCGESKCSEVGAELAAFYFKALKDTNEPEIYTIDSLVDSIMFGFGFDKKPDFLESIDIEFLRDYLLFTTLLVTETETEFKVDYVGDGFVVEQIIDGTIVFLDLADETVVPFYAYNYLPDERLSAHKGRVPIKTMSFSKKFYKNIGVASDGLRFIFKMPDELRNEFIALLKKGKEVPIKLFINRNFSWFQDDITIAL
jgi:hypothetical protein